MKRGEKAAQAVAGAVKRGEKAAQGVGKDEEGPDEAARRIGEGTTDRRSIAPFAPIA